MLTAFPAAAQLTVTREFFELTEPSVVTLTFTGLPAEAELMLGEFGTALDRWTGSSGTTRTYELPANRYILRTDLPTSAVAGYSVDIDVVPVSQPEPEPVLTVTREFFELTEPSVVTLTFTGLPAEAELMLGEFGTALDRWTGSSGATRTFELPANRYILRTDLPASAVAGYSVDIAVAAVTQPDPDPDPDPTDTITGDVLDLPSSGLYARVFESVVVICGVDAVAFSDNASVRVRHGASVHDGLVVAPSRTADWTTLGAVLGANVYDVIPEEKRLGNTGFVVLTLDPGTVSLEMWLRADDAQNPGRSLVAWAPEVTSTQDAFAYFD